MLFPDDDLPGHTDSPGASIEHQRGWVVPPEWEFVSEVREYERKPESDVRYDHEGAVDDPFGVVGLLLDLGESVCFEIQLKDLRLMRKSWAPVVFRPARHDEISVLLQGADVAFHRGRTGGE